MVLILYSMAIEWASSCSFRPASIYFRFLSFRGEGGCILEEMGKKKSLGVGDGLGEGGLGDLVGVYR